MCTLLYRNDAALDLIGLCLGSPQPFGHESPIQLVLFLQLLAPNNTFLCLFSHPAPTQKGSWARIECNPESSILLAAIFQYFL